MQEQASLREFFAHFGQSTLFCPGNAPSPGLEFLTEDLESLGLRQVEPLPPTRLEKSVIFVCGDCPGDLCPGGVSVQEWSLSRRCLSRGSLSRGIGLCQGESLSGGFS